MVRRSAAWLAAVAAICWLVPAIGRPAAADTLPSRLTDWEFWKLIDEVSEPNGVFRSDNLLSNEIEFQRVIGELTRMPRAGRAYLGVGPEQNFTYIAALKPSIAFIVDIRRGNLDLHLLYKALFELSESRTEFVSLLFSRPRQSSVGVRSSVRELFEAYAGAPANERLYLENLARIRDRLLTGHRFALSDDDVRGVEYVYRAYFMLGPGIRYSPVGIAGGTVQPTYAALMSATDERGQPQGFLASEDRFAFVKGLQNRNLVVPIVGNFAGQKALKRVGAYLKQRGATVGAFYLSNVEEYLRQDGRWSDFCANVSSLPIDAGSAFIRSVRTGDGGPMDGLRSEIGLLSQMNRCQ